MCSHVREIEFVYCVVVGGGVDFGGLVVPFGGEDGCLAVAPHGC